MSARESIRFVMCLGEFAVYGALFLWLCVDSLDQSLEADAFPCLLHLLSLFGNG